MAVSDLDWGSAPGRVLDRDGKWQDMIDYEAPQERTFTLTCYTKHGVVTKKWTGATIPGALKVPVMLPEHEVANKKFDPRKDWDAWIDGEHPVDPRYDEVVCLHFSGTLYIDERLRFMKRYANTTLTMDKLIQVRNQFMGVTGSGGGGGGASHMGGMGGNGGAGHPAIFGNKIGHL